MGSPISPIVANLFMEDLEVQAINTSPNPPDLWKRYVDDTFTIIKKANRSSFLEHINSINPNIQFSSKETWRDGSMTFLDILITPDEDGKPSTSLYRKPTHTDLYLQWDSHHTMPSKYSVVGTLYNKAKPICSSPQLLKEQHLFQTLKRCKYPRWALNRVKIKSQVPTKNKNRSNSNHAGQTNNKKQNVYMVVPYYRGLSESIKRSCRKYGVQVHFKGGLTIKNILMAPKDKDPILKKSGVIYRYKCDRVECDEEYIGESARTFAERFKEHQKASSPINDYYNTSGHSVTMDNLSIVGREEENLMRTIKEALYIRVNNPFLNRNIGKYHLPHIWDEVLFNIPELRLN